MINTLYITMAKNKIVINNFFSIENGRQFAQYSFVSQAPAMEVKREA